MAPGLGVGGPLGGGYEGVSVGGEMRSAVKLRAIGFFVSCTYQQQYVGLTTTNWTHFGQSGFWIVFSIAENYELMDFV